LGLVSGGQLVVVAVAVFGASLIQVVAGFGFGLLAVPVMTLAIPTTQAVVVSTLLGITMSTWQAFHLRAEARVELSRRLTIAAFCGMPIGLWLSSAVSEHVLQIVLGVLVLTAVLLLATGVTLHHARPSVDLAAGLLSGALNTSLSTNGPPLVFVLQARQLSPQVFRATITRVFAYSAVFAVVLFVARGRVHHDGLVAAGIALPAMAAGQLAGFPLRRHLDATRFRWLVLLLLTLAAISAIVAALR
jgi:uncharacterized membrane protein YfcA